MKLRWFGATDSAVGFYPTDSGSIPLASPTSLPHTPTVMIAAASRISPAISNAPNPNKTLSAGFIVPATSPPP